jgi:hypothetical protein
MTVPLGHADVARLMDGYLCPQLRYVAARLQLADWLGLSVRAARSLALGASRQQYDERSGCATTASAFIGSTLSGGRGRFREESVTATYLSFPNLSAYPASNTRLAWA